MKIKIAVYTIALNEEKHVKRWFESAKDADLLLIADTGSTDKTKYLAKSLGIKVEEITIKPWRFDVARNASLELVPEDFDICIQLDMDEVLPLGWRAKIEAAWEKGNQWPIYKHVTSRNSDGSARNYQHYFKIHPRRNVSWKYPIHEVVVPQDGVYYKRELIDLEVDHLQDPFKSRKSYLELLELANSEMPNDWRMWHYLNREYWYAKDWNRVLQTAEQAIKIGNGWNVERASTCMWASEAAQNLGFHDWAADWASKATREAPEFYEAWHWRAHIFHLQGKWRECFESSSKILILDREHHHLVKPEVWEWWGFDLMALASHKLGKNQSAVKYGRLALNGSPNDLRLRTNLNFYLEGLELETKIKERNDEKDNLNKVFPIPDFPQGGSEILFSALKKHTQYDESKVNIILSRCKIDLLDHSKINILWQHLDVDQEAVLGLENKEFLDRLDAIVFVSHWQYQRYRNRFKLPIEKCFVIKNAIEIIPFENKEISTKLKFAYTSTPWRGLDVLIDAFESINSNDVELHIYSSTATYGKAWYESNDKHYAKLYEKAKNMPNVKYFQYVPNNVLRSRLFQYDCLVYPSTWAETFCMAAVEAGSAGMDLIVSNLGALPEVLSERASYVLYSDEKNYMVREVSNKIREKIELFSTSDLTRRLEQSYYFNQNFSWNKRKMEWSKLFEYLKIK